MIGYSCSFRLLTVVSGLLLCSACRRVGATSLTNLPRPTDLAGTWRRAGDDGCVQGHTCPVQLQPQRLSLHRMRLSGHLAGQQDPAGPAGTFLGPSRTPRARSRSWPSRCLATLQRTRSSWLKWQENWTATCVSCSSPTCRPIATGDSMRHTARATWRSKRPSDARRLRRDPAGSRKLQPEFWTSTGTQYVPRRRLSDDPGEDTTGAGLVLVGSNMGGWWVEKTPLIEALPAKMIGAAGPATAGQGRPRPGPAGRNGAGRPAVEAGAGPSLHRDGRVRLETQARR